MNALEKFGKINTFLFDVDGVLTDGSLQITESGELLRRMNTRDGFALKLAVRSGYRVGIITGGSSAGVIKRLNGLDITEIYSGVSDKYEVLEELIDIYELNPKTTLYMGDDLPDLAPMRHVELPVCPADAAQQIIEVSEYVSPFKGGEGCVRDVIEKVLILQDKWTDVMPAK